MKPRAIVFDLFGDYLRYRGGQAPLRDLIALLGRFGVGASTARVVMSRLRKEGWFDTRPGRDGREAVYALNERSWHMLDEGRERIFAPPRTGWDGWWHMVIYYVPEAERGMREELRKELSWLGFGPLAASSKGLPADRDMAERCWDLDALNADYAAFLERYRTRMPRFRSGRLSPDEALVARTELIQDYRRFPFRDPNLPVELLPAGWHGTDAYELFVQAREHLRAGADRAVDEVTGTTAGSPADTSVSRT